MSELKRDIRYIKGVGPRKSYLLKRLDINTVEDMIWHMPRGYDDRRNIKKIGDLELGEKVTFYGKISGEINISRPRRNLLLTKFNVRDETGSIEIVFFNRAYLKRMLIPGQRVMINGEIKKGYKGLQVTGPIIEKADTQSDNRQCIVPIYPSTDGLSQKELISIQKKALQIVNNSVMEYLPERIIRNHRLCGIKFALHNIHFPISIQALKIAKYRLVFEEFFLLQLGLFNIKGRVLQDKTGIVLKNNDKIDEFIKKLPFALTEAQKSVFREISSDLEKDIPMNRLVQGDVGSGKTIVAIMSLLKAVTNGYQGGFMAPTEILAEQHYLSMKELLEPFGVRVRLLVGSLPKNEKDKTLKEIELGEVDIVVGTHALIQEGVNFCNLALVITDEQHRFGVRQRAVFADKGENPHVLVMTATPIPRTLALILYGDLDISTIDQLPPGRRTIKTYSRTSVNRNRIYDFVKRQLDEGRQAYVVCPLIEESEYMDIQSAIKIADELSTVLLKNYNVALLHGKMPTKEKEKIMAGFKEGNIDVLVSTTVIEVGIDVPNATIMVVESAERFGLTQLHQLRGRVGRGGHQSYCILINNSESVISKRRMDIMQNTADGFIISKKDLQIRGPGEFFGTKQHGLPELKVANLFKHISVLKTVQKEVEKMIAADPNLNLDNYPLLKEKLEQKFCFEEGYSFLS
ncbi:MAG: ATP-dependent DNA helicase RecG [Natronincolaceae bacterium]|jgi:ATP-dependent DNA helicase RecG|nr:ATP-dependent DNA helicase RecG [Bacillota bacterium]NLK90129.1 ATP-dependent DNA helicase RecG [Clostridiales bacterium]